MAVWVGFTDRTVGSPGSFVGLANYARLLRDPVFLRVVFNSIVYTFAAVGLKYGLGLGLALFLNQPMRFRTVIRSLVLLPWIVPTAVTALTWKWMFHEFGVLNDILALMGMAPVYWLAHPMWAMTSVIMINVWRGMPFFAISLLAGMQGIPQELYEATRVDGANRFQQFLYVTLPGLRHVTLVTLLLSFIWTFGELELVHIPTAGRPAGATHIFGTLTYERAFLAARMGEGVAVSLAFLPVLLAVIIYTTKLLNRE